MPDDKQTEAHFARIRPIVGTALHDHVVAVVGLPQAAVVVEQLAACGLRRWRMPSDLSSGDLRKRLQQRHGAALELEWSSRSNSDGCHRRHDAASLVLGMGDAADMRAAVVMANAANCAAVLACATPGGWHGLVHRPGDSPELARHWIERVAPQAIIAQPCQAQDWDLVTVAPLLASVARALLLRDSPYRRADLEALWQAGRRSLAASRADPLQIAWSAPGQASSVQAPGFASPPARHGHILIAGLGSIGSVAAAFLAPVTGGLALCDPDSVDASNPVRQDYIQAEIGSPKAKALARRLRQKGYRAVGCVRRLASEQDVEEVITGLPLAAALIATGTSADFAIARALRQHAIPHVVARCYPRAHYWEAILVDGDSGPCLEDIRGFVMPGPVAPPTPEQVAAYSDAGALEAEPATLVESGWAAAWAARLTAQLALPTGLRERWFLQLLGQRQHCLVGGIVVQPTESGVAYGIETPGQVRGWRRDEINRP